MTVEEISLTGDGDSSSEWGNRWWGLAYHASTDATLQYSPDDGSTWRNAVTNDESDATWTAAGHKIVMIPKGSHIKAVDGDITVMPMAASVAPDPSSI